MSEAANAAATPPQLMEGAGKWPVLDLQPGDADDVRDLFQRVFGHEMSAAFHHWKYGDGRGMATGMRDGVGTLVSHYGGTLRQMNWGPHHFTGVQVGDVMVAAEVRDVFARFGPFGRTARQFIDQYLGDGRPYPIGYGFPNARHVLLGRRLKLYWLATGVHALKWVQAPPEAQDFADQAGTGAWRTEALDLAQETHRQMVDALAQDMQGGVCAHMLWPTRRGDGWRHRFTHHPHFAYEVLGFFAPSSTQPVGVLVLKRSTGAEPWELMDWVGTAAFLPMVPAWAWSAVQARGGEALEVWCSQAVLDTMNPAWCAVAERSVACEVVVNHSTLLGQPIDGLANQFWLTGGDTDFR